MKKYTFLFSLLFGCLIMNAQPIGSPKDNDFKSGRELIGSSAHFNFYADASNANYWDSIQTPLEEKFTMFSGLLDFGGGMDSIYNTSTIIDVYLYNSHAELNAEYSGTLPDWKCGFYQKDSKSLNLCVPESTIQEDYYTDFTTLAFNIFSQLTFELNLNRRGYSNYPDYFKEGVGLYYSGFRPDHQIVNDYVSGLGHDPVVSDLQDITDIATSGLKDLIATRIQAQAITTYTSKNVTPGWGEGIWQNLIPLFYQNEENERMKLQYSTENFDFYCIQKDVQYLEDMGESCEAKCSDYQELFEMTYGHRFSILVLPYTETWSLLTNWGNSDGASAMQNENIYISSIDFCYESNLNEYLNFLIPHEFGHINHAHMYWEIPSGFYAEGMAMYSVDGSLEAITDNNEGTINQVFNSYMSSYGRLPTFDEFLENPNQDIDPYFFGHAFCSFVGDFYGGPITLKTFFNEGMVFETLNTTESEMEYYYIKFLEYLRDWVPNCPDAAFEYEIIGGDDTSMEVQFTDLSDEGANTITEWYWEFGDGTTSTEQNPTHTYNGLGTYTVYMTASDGELWDFEFKVDHIIVIEGANYAPSISGWEPQELSHEIVVDSTINFSVTATDPNGDELEYNWLINTVDQSESTSEFTYSFDELGTYSVICEVTDGEFTVDKTWTIVVVEANVAPVITDWEPQELTHEILTDSTLAFSITATDANEDELEYSWYLNTDVQSETSNEFIFNFDVVGSFTVKCIVSDGEFTDEKSWTINVSQANVAPNIISWLPLELSHEIVVDSTINFSVTATDPNGDELEYRWYINQEEQTGTTSEFPFYFNELGTFIVQCIVSDSELSDEKSWTVNVYPVGIIDVELHKISVFPNPCVDILNISTPENFGIYDAHVYSLNGEKILSIKSIRKKSIKVSVKELKSGFYFVVLENNDQVIREKFVKR